LRVADLANLRISVDSREVKSAANDLNSLGNAASQAEKKTGGLATAFGGLRGVLAGLGFGLIAGEIISMADTFSSLQGRLALVTNGTAELTSVQSQLFNMAQQTRVGFEGTVELYARLARSTESLGVSQSDVLQVTETINKALIVSGTSAQEASGALMQLGQGFASGALRGDELNSVMEGMPRVAQAIAQGMGITVGQLRKLGAEGKLTGDEVFNALLKMKDGIAQEFGEMPITVGQSMTVLRNSLIQFIGDINSATGFTEKLSGFIITLANNLDTLGFAAAAAATLFAAFQANLAVTKVAAYFRSIVALEVALGAGGTASAIFSAGLKMVQGAFQSLTATMMANPFIALATAIAAVSTLLYANRDAQVAVGGEVVRLGDIFTGVFEVIKQAVAFAVSVFRDGWASAFATVAPGLVQVGKAFDTILSAVSGIIRGYVNRMVGLFAGLGSAIYAALNLEDPIAAFQQAFGKDYVGIITDGAGKAIAQLAGIGKAANASGKQVAASVAPAAAALNNEAKAAKAAAKSMSDAEKEKQRLSEQTDEFIKSLKREVEEIGKSEKESRALQITRALEIAQTEDQVKAIKELAVQRENLLKIEEDARIQKEKDKTAADAIKEIQNLNKELQLQFSLIGKSAEEREAATRAFEDEAFVAEMVAKGVDASNEALKEYLRLRGEVAKGESVFAKEAADIERLANNLETAASMLGQNGVGAIAQGLLKLEVKFADGETRKLSEVLAKEFPKLAGVIGNAIAGAQFGGMAAGALGGRGSRTGGQVGGALASALGGEALGKMLGKFSALGGPIAGIAGGIIGGLVGGMLKKTPRAAATVSIASGQALMSGVTGSSSKLKGVASSLANGLIKGLSDVASQLGGQIGGAMNLSIGQRKDKFTVDVTGQGRTKGVPTFATEAEAVAFAMRHAISQGAITGISAGAQALIRGSGDLNDQLRKALAFENVFKELAREKDPLASALGELAEEMQKLKAIFDEAGASAEDYAKLEELFAIKQAKAIADANRPRRELEIQLMEAQGNAAGALAARRKLELESMDANLRGLQEQIWAAEDSTKATQELADAQAKAAEEAKAAAEAAKVLANDRRLLEIDLMEALGDASGALAERRKLELAAMDESLRGLQEQVWAALDARAAAEAAAEAQNKLAEETRAAAAAAQELADKRRALEINLMTALGQTAEAVAAQREIELAAMDESLRSLQNQIWAAEDARAASEAAAAAAREAAQIQAAELEAATKLAADRRELEIQLLEAQGFAIEALAARRQLELEGMDETLRALKMQIWAAQAKAEADAAAAKAAEEAAAVEAKAAKDAADAMQRYRDALTDVTKTVTDEIGRLRGINASSTSVLLKAQFATLTAQARTGNLDALAKLPELSRSIEEATIGSAGSALEVARIRAWLASSLAETLGAQAASNAQVNTAGAGMIFDGNETSTATGAQTADAISNMRGDLYNALYQIAKNTGKSYELMDRWDGDGLPDIREDASDYY
jgi:tape measure domain-containing protein